MEISLIRKSLRSQAIAPNDSSSVSRKGEFELAQGDLETAWPMVNKPGISPADPCFGRYLTLLDYRHDPDDEIAQCRTLLARKLDYPPAQCAWAHAILATMSFNRGERAAALASAEQARDYRERMRARGGIDPWLDAVFIQMDASLGNRTEVAEAKP